MRHGSAPLPGIVQAAIPALVAFLAVAALLAGQTGPEGTNVLVPFLEVAWRDGGVAFLWWIGAAGLGLALVAWGRRGRGAAAEPATDADDVALAIAVGCAARLAIDALLGSLGLLQLGGGAVPWALAIAGVAAGFLVLRDAPLPPIQFDLRAGWAVAAAFGAVTALLLLAASSAPGWLWSSEFGGYDALSYHLTLPKQWLMEGGPVGPVDGNVYSALPSFVEAAFLHLLVLRGDAIGGALACQWWAALATLATAFVVARLADRVVGPRSGAIAALLLLATPWVIVVGSLAYNDVVPCLLFAGGWLLLRGPASAPRGLDARLATLLALLAAAAVGAKPTALFFVALPLLAIALVEHRAAALRYVPLAAGIGLVVLAPWLARNAVAYGNPVFPFASGLLGAGPWSAEQHAVFAQAHAPGVALHERPLALFRAWIAHGLGAAPPGEPWFPQWGALPAAGLLGLGIASLAGRREHDALASARRRDARAGLLATGLICLAWMLLTHLQSRFLLATAVPLALGGALLLRAALANLAEARARAIAVGIAVVAAGLPFIVYLREPVKGQPLRSPAWLVDGIGMMTGARMAQDLDAARAAADEETARRLLSLAPTPFMVNFLLPPEAGILGIGYATPLYLARPIATTTVWDRGDLDEVIAARPDAPAEWGAELRARGHTHAIVDPVMLERWKTSGWLSPGIGDVERFAAFLKANRLLARSGDGCLLIEFNGRAAPAADGPFVPAPLPAIPSTGPGFGR